jgi:hypothetical protein
VTRNPPRRFEAEHYLGREVRARVLIERLVGFPDDTTEAREGKSPHSSAESDCKGLSIPQPSTPNDWAGRSPSTGAGRLPSRSLLHSGGCGDHTGSP